MHRTVFLFVLGGFAASSFGAPPKDNMNPIAERYAHLVLALGQHDPDYVDAFYGPAEWKTQAEKEKKSLDAIAVEATQLLQKLRVDGTRSRDGSALVDSSDTKKLRVDPPSSGSSRTDR